MTFDFGAPMRYEPEPGTHETKAVADALRFRDRCYTPGVELVFNGLSVEIDAEDTYGDVMKKLYVARRDSGLGLVTPSPVPSSGSDPSLDRLSPISESETTVDSLIWYVHCTKCGTEGTDKGGHHALCNTLRLLAQDHRQLQERYHEARGEGRLRYRLIHLMADQGAFISTALVMREIDS